MGRNDFNNPELFSEDSDSIALITGPLSATDTDDVRTILEGARHSEDAADFVKQVDLFNFSSESQRKKLKAFHTHLKKSNNGTDVPIDKVWRFMKSYHLIGYDLDSKSGVTLSLLHSLIAQYSPDNANALWTQIINEVQFANQNSGTIKLDSLSEEIRFAFKRQAVETIPSDFARDSSLPTTVDWNKGHFASELAITCLLGHG